MTVGSIAAKPGMAEGRVEPREFLALSFDHDIVDLAQRLKELAERAAVPESARLLAMGHVLQAVCN